MVFPKVMCFKNLNRAHGTEKALGSVQSSLEKKPAPPNTFPQRHESHYLPLKNFLRIPFQVHTTCHPGSGLKETSVTDF